LNGTDHFTIFDLPISVSNTISDDPNRPACDQLNNPLLSDPLRASSAGMPIPFLNGAGVDTTAKTGLGAEKPAASPEDGLGSGGVMTRLSGGMIFLALFLGVFLVL